MQLGILVCKSCRTPIAPVTTGALSSLAAARAPCPRCVVTYDPGVPTGVAP